MITSVRIEASGDDPGDVKSSLDSALIRIGLGIGDVTDEVYERQGFGYIGRIKVNFQIPQTSDLESDWNAETDSIKAIVEARLGRQQQVLEQNLGFSGTWTGPVTEISTR